MKFFLSFFAVVVVTLSFASELTAQAPPSETNSDMELVKSKTEGYFYRVDENFILPDASPSTVALRKYIADQSFSSTAMLLGNMSLVFDSNSGDMTFVYKDLVKTGKWTVIDSPEEPSKDFRFLMVEEPGRVAYFDLNKKRFQILAAKGKRFNDGTIRKIQFKFYTWKVIGNLTPTE